MLWGKGCAAVLQVSTNNAQWVMPVNDVVTTRTGTPGSTVSVKSRRMREIRESCISMYAGGVIFDSRRLGTT